MRKSITALILLSHLAHSMNKEAQLTFITSDKQLIAIPRKLAVLSTTIKNMVEDCNENPDQVVPLAKTSKSVLNEIKIALGDLQKYYNGILPLGVVAEMDHAGRKEHGESFSRQWDFSDYAFNLDSLITTLERVNFLFIPELSILYAAGIAAQVQSDESLDLLYRADNQYTSCLRSLDPVSREYIRSHLIPRNIGKLSDRSRAKNQTIINQNAWQQCIREILPYSNSIKSVTFSPDKKASVVVTKNALFGPRVICIAKNAANNWEKKFDLYGKSDQDGAIHHCMFSPDSKYIIMQTSKSVLRCCLSERGESPSVLTRGCDIKSATFFLDSETILIEFCNGKIKLITNHDRQTEMKALRLAFANTLQQKLLIILLNRCKMRGEPIPQNEWTQSVLNTFDETDKQTIKQAFGNIF